MRYSRILVITILITLLLASCQEDPLPTQVPEASVPTLTPIEPGDSEPAATAEPADAGDAPAVETAVPASPTPSEPLAATVNGQPIYLSAYEKELARYEQAQEELGLQDDDTTNYREIVLNALIENQLIVQAAEASGFAITEEMIEARFAELQEAAGGPEPFIQWLATNQWTEEEFRQTLPVEMLTELMVESVTADVPFAVEQINARYIQVDDPALAQSLLDQILAGADFAFLAQQNSLDRITGENGGDLGFFARGGLLVPEIEEAAFALQPGEVSEIIEAARPGTDETVYYIVQVIERDPERQLTDELRFNLLQDRFVGWLDNLWAEAEIIRFVDVS